jgi:two-component system chemotaxis sensor kinase CheA
MDVVRANIARIGGIVEVDSRLGHGVRFTLKVPLTLTIIPALTVCAGDQTFAIPRSSVEEIVRSRGEGVRIERLGGTSIVTLRGRRLPLVSLAAMLDVEAAEGSENILTLLKVAGGGVYALEVDKVQDHEELVIKPASPALMATGLYAGTTLADDGRPVLLLDPAGIAARAGIALDRSENEEAPAAEAVRADFQALLLRSLAGASRVVPLSAVERIEEVPSQAVQRRAGRLNVRIGDRILPLEGCDAPIPEGKIKVLRLTDGFSQIGYGFAEVIDTVSIGSEVTPAAVPGEIGGVVLVGDEQAEMIDLHWLFAGQAGAAPVAERPLCVLPAGDPWMETFLRPIVESAGYRVVDSGDALAAGAELVIVAGGDAPAANQAARIVRLRNEPEPAGKNDTSIHRYDRAALIGALGRGTRVKKG